MNSKKGIVLSAILGALGMGELGGDQPDKDGEGAADGRIWHSIIRAEEAVVSVERVLYELEGSPHFF